MTGSAPAKRTTDAPKISVIIPHYEDLAGLDLCLAALDAQTLPGETFEVIVADNASSCGILAVLDVVGSRASVVIAKEKGAGPARNAGVRAARGDIFAFTDSDCRPAADWLEQGLPALEASDFAGGAMRVETAGDVPTPSEAFELVFAFQNETYVRRKGFSVTANLFVPRRVFDGAGPFSNGLSEDLEWCSRARAKGYTIGYAGSAVVAHPARHSWPEIRRKWQRLTAESFGLARRKASGAPLWLARSYLVLASALPDLARVLMSRRLRGIEARLGAAAILVRLRLFRFFEAHRLFFQNVRTRQPHVTISTSQTS